MNEQFSKLYHLAWNYSEFDDEYKEKPTYERRCVVQSRIFAELIVKECVDICDAYGMPDGTSPTAMILSSAIKKRFGVKE